ncbi:MAG TPA: hypothetical protein VJ600_11425 [Holophagaceae bacterium]|nr:hypothetical protein [Holophagaceae bacterium]
MRRPLIAVLAVLPMLAQQPDPALDQVLQGWYGTQGGLAKMKATRTRRVEGHFLGLTAPASYVQTNERPNHYWLETTSGPDRRMKVFDGRSGFEVTALGLRRQLMPEEIADLETDFDGPLVDAQAKGIRLQYLGAQPLGYSKADVVKASLPGGEVRTFYFDVQTHRLVRQVMRRLIQDQLIETEVRFSEFRTVDGRDLAFKVVTGPLDQPPAYTVVVDAISFDKPVETPSLPTPPK